MSRNIGIDLMGQQTRLMTVISSWNAEVMEWPLS
jgi:hypothetical protein